MELLNRIKQTGGFVFALGCLVMWVSFFGLDLIYSWIPSQIKIGITYLIPSQIITFLSHHISSFFSNPIYSWGIGAKASILGFLLFFGAWIISKIRSKYGHCYWDWKASGIAKKMGVIYALTIVFWIISVMLLKTDASSAILENSWPQEWITGFLLTLILIGLYMRKIRPGGRSLLSKIKGVLVPIFIVLIIVGGFIWLTGFSFPVGNEESDIKYYDLEKDVFKAINEERKDHGFNSVTWDNRVAMVARGHSKNMAKNSFFSHANPLGVGLEGRLAEGGVNYYTCGEVILKQSSLHGTVFIPIPIPIPKGHESIVNETIEGWMGSPGHRRIILTSSFSRVGVGVWKKGTTYYFTADFVS